MILHRSLMALSSKLPQKTFSNYWSHKLYFYFSKTFLALSNEICSAFQELLVSYTSGPSSLCPRAYKCIFFSRLIWFGYAFVWCVYKSTRFSFLEFTESLEFLDWLKIFIISKEFSGIVLIIFSLSLCGTLIKCIDSMTLIQFPHAFFPSLFFLTVIQFRSFLLLYLEVHWSLNLLKWLLSTSNKIITSDLMLFDLCVTFLFCNNNIVIKAAYRRKSVGCGLWRDQSP